MNVTGKCIKFLCVAFVCASLLAGCRGKDSGGSLTKQAMAELEANNFDTALEHFRQALSSGEDEVLAKRGEGMALMGMARYQEAEQAFESALAATDEKMPETVRDIRLYLATVQYRAKDYTAVINTCEKIIAGGDLPEARFLTGASYLGLGERTLARTNFDQAVRLSPGDYSLYLQIYKNYEAVNLTAVGDEYLQTALSIKPQNSRDCCQIGQIYYYLEKYSDAKSILNGPVEERYVPALTLMGEIYLAEKDYSHAMAMYQLVMNEDGITPQVYNGMALCSIAAGNYEAALGYISQGLSMEDDTNRQELLFNEIVTYERKLDFSKAYQKALDYAALYPTDEAGQKELIFLASR